jgi:hypothetical protein
MLRAAFRSVRYACAMRSTPDQDARLRLRLIEAVEKVSNGNAEAFGKALGFNNGGYIRLCVRESGPRPVRETIIDRVHALPGMAGWFDPVLSTVSAADLKAQQRLALPASPWPLPKLSPLKWSEYHADDRAAAESAYVSTLLKAHAERLELSTPSKSGKRPSRAA